ncbi:MAG TPA: EamA family transporter, partial [Desulfobacteria bacterium]|nr:EamA family transporter [Desulfobacteria bacterium]
MNSRKVQLLADLGLVFVTLVWGATFVTVQEAIKKVEPYYFLSLRFGLATLIMIAAANKRLLHTSFKTVLKGILVGLMLFSGYAFQTFGLKYTTASNTGFITGLSVVIVPVFIAVAT